MTVQTPEQGQAFVAAAIDSLRSRLSKRPPAKPFRCKNLIAVIENPTDVRNIGTVIRNVNALGV
jgi:tRNA G18 (ribose-2'-O)-methylase SpoU